MKALIIDPEKKKIYFKQYNSTEDNCQTYRDLLGDDFQMGEQFDDRHTFYEIEHGETKPELLAMEIDGCINPVFGKTVLVRLDKHFSKLENVKITLKAMAKRVYFYTPEETESIRKGISV